VKNDGKTTVGMEKREKNDREKRRINYKEVEDFRHIRFLSKLNL